MSADPYGPAVRALFTNPEHAGDVVGGSRIFVADQGVRIRLSARLAAGIVTELRFRAWGCPHVIAAAEALCASAEGRPAAELGSFDAGSLIRTLPVPVEKTGRILVLEDAARSLWERIQQNDRPGTGLTG